MFERVVEEDVSRLPHLFGSLSVVSLAECNPRLCFKRWLAQEKTTRLPIDVIQAALKTANVAMDSDEVECVVANMIYKVSPTITRRSLLRTRRAYQKRGLVSIDRVI